MGEYFFWINIEKEEVISPPEFDCGSKSHESIHRDCGLIGAMYELLANEWKGDRIVFIGDESPIPMHLAPDLFGILYQQTVAKGYRGDMFDTVFETYHNLGGLFCEAEEFVREMIKEYLECRNDPVYGPGVNEYRIDPDHPYDGLFKRKGKTSGYVVNYTKKKAYCLGKTRILYMNGDENDYADPLPVLLGYGRQIGPGAWIGDRIGVEDSLPEGVELLESVTLDW